MGTHRQIRPALRWLLALGLVLAVWALGLTRHAVSKELEKAITIGDFNVTGAHTHANLTIFVIHGKDQVKTEGILTLQEALAQKQAVVHETGNVNQLSVENISPDREVYIQSGDIVKGGQ